MNGRLQLGWLWEVASTESSVDVDVDVAVDAVAWCHRMIRAAVIMNDASGLDWGILIVVVG